MDPVQSSILFLNCLSLLADFIMSGIVLHSILPLNFSEFNPYLTAFVLASWTTSSILRLYFVGLRSKIFQGKEGFLRLGFCRPPKAKLVDFYYVLYAHISSAEALQKLMDLVGDFPLTTQISGQ